MLNKLTTLALALFFCFNLFAQDETAETDNDVIEYTEEEIIYLLDSINQSFSFEYGAIDLADGVATLTVPDGYKYLDPEQSEYLLTELWGNPPSPTLGLLFPEKSDVIGENLSYAVEINYEEEGYIDDEDAADIDYDELEEQMKEEVSAANSERIALGYGSIDFIGWASSPFYDQADKKLHWAKELRFEEEEESTLNYEIRILGRKGFLDMVAIGSMTDLPAFKSDINTVLSSVDFNDGYRYEDFDSSMDKVAAYGIGGLVAGKVLAKVGFFAVLAKFGKFIVIGIVGLFAAFKNRIFGKKEEEEVAIESGEE